ncbi:hypothetical protein D3C75_757470 [compost metagenome]
MRIGRGLVFGGSKYLEFIEPDRIAVIGTLVNIESDVTGSECRHIPVNNGLHIVRDEIDGFPCAAVHALLETEVLGIPERAVARLIDRGIHDNPFVDVILLAKIEPQPLLGARGIVTPFRIRLAVDGEAGFFIIIALTRSRSLRI